jgi:glycosyltransferase involved in cell wall biosynthesis
LRDSDVALFKSLCRGVRPKHAVTVTACIPSLVQPDPDAVLNILRTTFETDRIPPEWIAVTDAFDEVWVFSEHNRLSFQRGGAAPEKLRVLGSFVDTSVFSPRGKKRKLPQSMAERFVFLSVFDWQLRKGWDVLLRAYCEEFTPDMPVGLLLKTTRWHGHDAELIRRQMCEVLSATGYEMEERPDIQVIEESLTADELAALYRSADAFVLASRGEGWGRPYMEAMACGLPAIGTRGSGNMDFMNDENSFLVATHPVPVPKQAAEEIPVYRGHWWLEPDVADMRAKLRIVFEDSKRRSRIARQGAADMRSKFDVQCARGAVEENLRQAEQRFLTPQLPEASATDVRVVLEGELFAGHSFANVNEKLTQHLGATAGIAFSVARQFHNPAYDRQSPVAPAIRPYINRSRGEAPQITIRHAFPPNWHSPDQGKWVHIQPWEYGALPLDWVEPLRDRVDEIWAPSNYVKRVYERSGICADKIHVIPWGISPDVFHSSAASRLLPTEKTFRFLFVGGTIARKGIDTLLDAYCREFTRTDDVCLVIKDMGARSFYRYGNHREHIQRLIKDTDMPEVLYFDQPMTEGQLAGLYTACDCLVSPYRGEGFGLPILEAMACGLAPIVPLGGASDDFVDERCGYLLNANEVECTHDWRLCGVPMELAIDTADLRRTMRRAYDERDQTGRLGATAGEQVLSRYTWAKTAERMVGRLRELAASAEVVRLRARPARRATLSLCIVFRNDEGALADCLGRLRPFVDEIVAVDAGSEDRSSRVAQEYGARVYGQAWEDSFARAKNQAIVRATSDWILCLDPGDQIDDPPARQLASLLSSLDRDVYGANVRYHHGASIEQQVRIIRNRNDVYFELRGGPHVRGSIERAGGRIVDLDIDVRRGFPASESVVEEQRRLSHRDLAEKRGDPNVLLALGRTHFRSGNMFHAECYLHDFLTNAGPKHPDYLPVVKLLISAHQRKGDPHRAIEVAEAAQQYFPSERDLALQPPAHGVSAIVPHSTSLPKLYLGAGQKRLPGYTHVDIQDGEGMDVVYDLNRLPWPWQDNSVSIIVAEDVVEHLEINLLSFCNEAWRVLTRFGELFIRTPHHQGDSSFIDPTHHWHLNQQSFEYLDLERHWGRTYPHYTDRKWRILSLGIRGPQNIHALLSPRKSTQQKSP